jgi:hypothetical protein
VALSAAISVPAAILLAVAAPSHAALGFLPVVLVAHLLATMSASLFMFAVLLIARAATALCMGAQFSERLGTVLQLLTIAGLSEVFFFTHPPVRIQGVLVQGLLPVLVERLMAGDLSALTVPPMPFAAFYAWMVGAAYPSLAFEASIALLALAAALCVVVLVYVLPARLLARRVAESQPRQHAGVISSLARAAAVALPSSPIVRSVTTFIIASLLRSRRHRLIVIAYLGIAIASGTLSVIAGGIRGSVDLRQPGVSLLSLPLVLMFFTTYGLRAAFAVPTDADANWTFRLARPPVRAALDATAIAMLLLGIVPIAGVAWVGAWLLGWTSRALLILCLLDLVSGTVLVQVVLREWRKIPFACGYFADAESLKSRWLGQLVPFILFAFVNAAIQKIAMRSNQVLAWYVCTAIAAMLVLRVRQSIAVRQRTPQFDASAGDEMATLNLSEALS